MRRTSGLAIAAIAALLLAAPSWAGTYDYSLGILACSGSTYKMGNFFYASDPGYATEGRDAYDAPLDKITNIQVPIWVATYKANGVGGWNSTDGFYQKDARPPLVMGQSRIEDIYLWEEPTGSPQSLTFCYLTTKLPVHGTFSLNLVGVPSGITYTGPQTWGSSLTAAWGGVFPYYATTDGRTGYHFQAIFTAPEPSSLFAIFAGLTGLGGLAWRRRGR